MFQKVHLLGETNLDISSKFCPVCKNKNDRDAIICLHCGATLDSFPPDSVTTRSTGMQIIHPTNTKELRIDQTMVPAGGIAFYVEGTSRPVFSCSDKEFVMGRKVGQTAGLLLDLAPFGGYHLGLSRRHALIRRIGEGYEIMDLSSSNGTWLNDERLEPNKAYPLASGSQLRLARMRFFVVYRTVLETSPKI